MLRHGNDDGVEELEERPGLAEAGGVQEMREMGGGALPEAVSEVTHDEEHGRAQERVEPGGTESKGEGDPPPERDEGSGEGKDGQEGEDGPEGRRGVEVLAAAAVPRVARREVPLEGSKKAQKGNVAEEQVFTDAVVLQACCEQALSSEEEKCESKQSR